MYSRFSSTSMIAARVAGVPRPFSFMASESSFSSSVLPAVSMAVSSVASVKRLGARVFLRTALGVEDVLRLVRARSGGQRLLGLRPSLRSSGLDVENLPADLLDGGAGGVIAVDIGAVGDGGDDGGHRPDVIVVPGAEQAAADEVVDLVLRPATGRVAGRRGGGDDGVVVA